MSYCVNCGVELAPSEPKCPLCGVEVVNPLRPWKKPRSRPYPNYFDEVMRGVDRRYFALISALLLMIPVTVCLLIDIFTSGDMTWSSYVVGAAVLAMVVALVPLSSKEHRPYRYLVYNTVTTLAYLMLIDYKTPEPGWFLPLALPIALSLSVISGLITTYFQLRKSDEILVTLALLLFGAGAFTMLVEVFIRLYREQSVLPVWSWYALVPCLLSGAAFLILNRRNRWKESVRKRLFI